MVQIELQPLPPATLHTNSYDDLRQAAPADRSGTTSPDRLSLNPGSQLSRVDGGQDAWVFLAAATAIEVLVWGEPNHPTCMRRGTKLRSCCCYCNRPAVLGELALPAWLAPSTTGLTCCHNVSV